MAVFRVLPAWRALYRALDAETAKNTGLASGCRRARLLSRASTVKAAAAASAAAAVGRKGLGLAAAGLPRASPKPARRVSESRHRAREGLGRRAAAALPPTPPFHPAPGRGGEEVVLLPLFLRALLPPLLAARVHRRAHPSEDEEQTERRSRRQARPPRSGTLTPLGRRIGRMRQGQEQGQGQWRRNRNARTGNRWRRQGQRVLAPAARGIQL